MTDVPMILALRNHLATVQDLRGAAGTLGWDELVMMPPAAAEARGYQMATLAKISHELFVSGETSRLLDAAEKEAERLPYESDEASLVRVTRRDLDRAIKVPVDLVEAIELAASRGYEGWVAARESDDFDAFLPFLEKNIELKQRYLELFEFEESPYDVLIEDYEYGMRASEIQTVFDAVRGSLGDLIRHVGATEQAPHRYPPGSFPAESQQNTNMSIISRMGFSPDAWRLDTTVHPFMEGGGNDIRLTTKYDPDDWQIGLLSTIHEFGHGLYEYQVSKDLMRTALGTGCSMTLHESQSRLCENMIGRSQPFWEFAGPILREAYPDALGGTSNSDLYRHCNQMRPSLIRIEADELTYGMHLILRFELERALFEGDLTARELPEAWNAKVKELLDLDVPTNREGVLQDVHWSGGAFGYFPTYLLGSILSAQIWERLITDVSDVDTAMAAGEFGDITTWLGDHVHRYGRKFTPKETIELAVGGPLDAGPYLRYLTDKVESLYGAA